jgi:hypothetical protein
MIKSLIAIAILFLLSACTLQKQVWISDWKQAAPLTIQRAGAAAVIDDDVIYLIGGVDGKDFLATTEYARIRPDGSLGPWKEGSRLNEARGFTDAVVHNGYLYVVGGGNGPFGHNLLRSVERAKLQADGTLGPWLKEKNEMMVTRRCTKLVATDKALYSFGGFGGVLLDTVESAQFQKDGSLGEWKLEPEVMTMQRYVNGVKKLGNNAYVIGGHDQSKGVGVTSVEWSRFGDNGNLQKWQAASPLQTGRYGLSTAEYGDYIYAMGGLSGAEYLDSIEKSKIGPNGALGPWQPTTRMGEARANFNTIDYKNWIYIIGGATPNGYLNSVAYATLNNTGDIGYWGTAAEAEAAKTKAAALKVQDGEFPNEGVAKEVIQTSGYTYIRVQKDNQSIEWIAGPRMTVNVNARVRYTKGVYMSNFHSKELKRTFTGVLFVGQVQKVE